MRKGLNTALKVSKFVIWFGAMAGIGILLGCYIHGSRVNQTTVMSGVAFVREMPYGEEIVGWTEKEIWGWTETPFGPYIEQENLEDYLEKHKGNIK